ncbi:MAG: dentilisin complex serine proteinase subunit PrtP [Treponema sp.]
MSKKVYFLFAFIVLFSCKVSNNVGIIDEGLVDSLQKENIILKVADAFDISKLKGIKVMMKGNYSENGEYYLIKNVSNLSNAELIAELETKEGVLYAVIDEVISLPKYTVGEEPIKTFGLSQGDLTQDPDGQNYEYALQITKARDWYDEQNVRHNGAYSEVGYGEKQVVVAIIDTGLNMNHRDFLGVGGNICLYAKSAFSKNIKNGDYEILYNPTTYDGHFDFSKLRVLPIPSNEDGGGHGTHCTGTICALGDNNEGIAGVAWKNTKIISYKGIGKASGSTFTIYGSLGDLADIVPILKKQPADRTVEERKKLPECIPSDFVITQKTVPCNMSLGGNTSNSFAIEMINKAIANDILPIIAMGNDGRNRSHFPAANYGVLAVGATNELNKRAPFSNAGPWMSVCAPGNNIISTSHGKWENNKPLEDSTGTQFLNGTSMATPFVTGTIGYLLSFEKGHNLTPYQIKKILENTADKIDNSSSVYGYNAEGFSEWYGYGRVNVLEVAKCITERSGAKPIPTVNSFYIEKPMTITDETATVPLSTKVRLYEGKDCVGIGYLNKKKQIKFYGLKKDKEYTVKVQTLSGYKHHTFTATDVSTMEYTFH